MNEELTYEQAVEKLQSIVERLETGEDSLENAMKLFEEGAKLSTLCYEKLNAAQQRMRTVDPQQEAPHEE